MMLTKEIPIHTGAAAVYPYSKALEQRATTVSTYDDPIELFRVVQAAQGSRYIHLPRQQCPMGEDKRVRGVPYQFNLSWEARNPEQSRVVGEATDLLLQDQSFILNGSTGFGKTACSMPLIAAVGRQTLIIVTKEDVKNQWKQACMKFLNMKAEDIGVIQGDKVSVIGKPVVIAMIQSICKIGRYPADTFKGFGFVIADEVHRLGADQFGLAMWQIPALLRLGLSATVKRKDGKDIVFRSHIGPVKVRVEAIPMIPKVLVMQSGWKKPGWLKNVQAGRTMHINKMLGKDKDRNVRIADFISTAYTKGRNVVFFSDLKDHLEYMHDLLYMRGVKGDDMGYYVGGLKEHEQDKAKAKQVVLTTYQMCSEATDAPWWDVGVFGTPKSDVVQIAGRILREWEGKPQPVLLDVVDGSLSLFRGYAKSREKWYKHIGAEIVII